MLRRFSLNQRGGAADVAIPGATSLECTYKCFPLNNFNIMSINKPLLAVKYERPDEDVKALIKTKMSQI